MISFAWWLLVGPIVAAQLAVSVPLGLVTWPIAYAIETYELYETYKAEPCE